MAPLRPKVAFVTGANGITGNALVEHLIRQPESEWSEIIITSRRQPTQVFWQDPRIRFIALDFLKPVDELIATMKPLCGHVTHAFFASYVHSADFAQLRTHNVPLFEHFLTAIDSVAGESLQRVVIHTGGKHNGVHLGPVEAPIHEGMPRYHDHGENFYYIQEDFMFNLASKRKWDWNVIRPNAIIGFTPAGNGMSAALTLAIYILCCREAGQIPVFPGNAWFWNAVDDSSYAPSIADMSVWAATHDHTRNESFVHTNGDVMIWKHFWPKLTAYYGIELPEDAFAGKGEGDSEHMTHAFLMEDWARGHKDVWQQVTAKYGGHKDAFDWGTWDFFDWAMGKGWCTVGSISKARKYGWTRYDDTYEVWIKTFRSFENAGILPIMRQPAPLPVESLPLLPNPADAVNERAAKRARLTNPPVEKNHKSEATRSEKAKGLHTVTAM